MKVLLPALFPPRHPSNRQLVRLVLYPGEGHGNAKSAVRFDYVLRALH